MSHHVFLADNLTVALLLYEVDIVQYAPKERLLVYKDCAYFLEEMIPAVNYLHECGIEPRSIECMLTGGNKRRHTSTTLTYTPSLRVHVERTDEYHRQRETEFIRVKPANKEDSRICKELDLELRGSWYYVRYE